MQGKTHHPHANLDAIFISLELSRSTWLVTSLCPSVGGKISKHSVPAGDISALLGRFSDLRQKALSRTGKSFAIVVIQEAGLDLTNPLILADSYWPDFLKISWG
jgi:transposase